jgi:putative FmdB family regulatory protein
MPLYEYKCKNCEVKQERLVRDRKLTQRRVKCMACGHYAYKVAHPGGNFALKGNWPGKGGA